MKRCTSVVIGTNVASIGGWTFCLCTGLTNVTIGTKVTSIGENAFQDCTNLTSITIPNSGVTNIVDYAFDGCRKLRSITLPSSLTRIGFSAFWQCWSLTSITIPASVTYIDGWAFEDCTGLTGVYFQGNTPSTPSTDSSVFAHDSGATAYYLPGTTGWSSTFSGLPAVLWNPSIQTTNTSFYARTNRFGFTVSGTANIPIVVEASPSLPTANWIALQTCTLTNGSIYFSDPEWTNYPARLYRIRSP